MNLTDPVTPIEVSELLEAVRPVKEMHEIARRMAFELEQSREKLKEREIQILELREILRRG